MACGLTFFVLCRGTWFRATNSREASEGWALPDWYTPDCLVDDPVGGLARVCLCLFTQPKLPVSCPQCINQDGASSLACGRR